jgi:hypothetical protein
MADITRSSASGKDWTAKDLLSYNIRVVHQDAATFFGVANLPEPQVDNVLLTAQDIDAVRHRQDSDLYCLFSNMDRADAMPILHGEESAVIDLVVPLFRALGAGYSGLESGRVVRSRKTIPSIVCGATKSVRADSCVVDDSDMLCLIIQEDKGHLDGGVDPEPLLIAKSIAAFAANNDERVRTLGINPLASKVMPGINMKGTMPTFYKIPVTANLVSAVQLGQFPGEETVVYAHVPRLPRPSDPSGRYIEGMKLLDNRQIIFSCYEAFKQFL